MFSLVFCLGRYPSFAQSLSRTLGYLRLNVKSIANEGSGKTQRRGKEVG